MTDLEWGAEMLPKVSRTFALCITLLDPPWCEWVRTSYLLCRIADTIEDAPGLSLASRRALFDAFMGALRDGNGSFHRFVPFSSSDGSQATTDSRKIGANYGKGEAFRVIVVDVRGTPVAIYLESETGPADKFADFLKFANQLLRSLTFPR